MSVAPNAVRCKGCGKAQSRLMTDGQGRVVEVASPCRCAYWRRVNGLCRACDRPATGRPKVAVWCDVHRKAARNAAKARHLAKVGDVSGVYDGAAPGRFGSYRGYHERLALEPEGEPCTVAELLSRCRAADGATFTGHKGGEFTMDRRTLVHIAPFGTTNDNRLVAIQQRIGTVALVVAHVEDW